MTSLKINKKIYYMKYTLCDPNWCKKVYLNSITNVIVSAIHMNIPTVVYIHVGKNYYYFETTQIPTRQQLSNIGRYISRNSWLKNIVKQYKSNTIHPPTRKLFHCIDKNF